MTTYQTELPTPAGETAEPVWDSALADLLHELSRVQDELLDVLGRKQQLMAQGDVTGMQQLQPREEALCEALQQCQERRVTLLRQAAKHGMPADNLKNLATAVSSVKPGDLGKQVGHAESRMRLLQHQSLANWVLAQKALLHVAQMLEILATGGRLQPTYGNNDYANSTGGILVDQEA